MHLTRSLSSLCLICALSVAAHGCKTSPSDLSPIMAPTPPDTEVSPAPLTSEGAGNVRVIHTLDWPAGPWGISLVGIDEDLRHAIILLKDTSPSEPKLAIDTISLESGQTVARWRAEEALARAMVNGYPGFRGMQSGSFNEDLVRYAALIGAIGSWSFREATPPLGVLPNPSNQDIIFGTQPEDGQDGDWLMYFDARTQKTSRLDRGLRASYHPSFSPDGSTIAWIGGSLEFASSGRQIGYVLRVADTSSRKHKPVPAISELLSTPIWSSDSRTLYAFGKTRREHCLFAINARTLDTRQLLCHDTNIDIVISPDTSRALLLLHASSDKKTQQLVTLELATGDELMKLPTEKVQGLGAFGIWIDQEHFALLSDLGNTLSILHTSTGELLTETPLTTEDYTIRGRHGMKIIGDELIVLRQHQTTQNVDIVGITIK